jgi:hypothetical protein
MIPLWANFRLRSSSRTAQSAPEEEVRHMSDSITVEVLRESLDGLDPDMPVLVVRQEAPDLAPLPVRDLTDYHYGDGKVELHHQRGLARPTRSPGSLPLTRGLFIPRREGCP